MEANPPDATTSPSRPQDASAVGTHRRTGLTEMELDDIRRSVSNIDFARVAAAPSGMDPWEARIWGTLDELARDACEPRVAPKVGRDLRTLLQWLGVDNYEELTDEHRYRWLDAHRLYLLGNRKNKQRFLHHR